MFQTCILTDGLQLQASCPADLVGSDGHAHLIPNAQQQQAPLRAVDGDLADQLVKGLSIQLLPHGAQPGLPCLQSIHISSQTLHLQLNYELKE